MEFENTQVWSRRFRWVGWSTLGSCTHEVSALFRYLYKPITISDQSLRLSKHFKTTCLQFLRCLCYLWLHLEQSRGDLKSPFADNYAFVLTITQWRERTCTKDEPRHEPVQSGQLW